MCNQLATGEVQREREEMQLTKKKYFSAGAVVITLAILMVWQKGCGGDIGYSHGLPVRTSNSDSKQGSVSSSLSSSQGCSVQTSRLRRWRLHDPLVCGRDSGGSQLQLGSLLVSFKHVNTVYELLRKGEAKPNTRMGYMGGYSFGICDALHNGRPCSYFTMVRNPYERIISCYFFCQRSSKDQLCTALNAANVTLKEWALHQGSYFFNQILLHPHVCQGTFDQYFKLDGIQHNFWYGDPPCWFKQKVILGHYLTSEQENILLDYVLDHLEQWFASIGIIEEFDLSLGMFQHIYGLPFKDDCVGKHFQTGKYKKRKKNVTTNEEQVDRDQMIQQLKAELQADPEVRRALHADLVIYDKAKEIFDKQKEVYYTIKNGKPPDKEGIDQTDA
ncbi:hypothetical protein BSL78_10382 [Apostichopus japonicus]|uniref:Sulfotransferase domain-containing protein n=1 Tax=Stichopus japonicus TaxID=307972 RepID=A0A2G8KXM0_STIJA|nr:hypothetical protein BSL78_10382 [Apostichopus japonicus]